MNCSNPCQQGVTRGKVFLVCVLGAICFYAVLRVQMQKPISLQAFLEAAKEYIPCRFSQSFYSSQQVEVTNVNMTVTERVDAEEKGEEARVDELTALLVQRLESIPDGNVSTARETCLRNNSATPCQPVVPCKRPLETRSPRERVRELITSSQYQPSVDQLATVLSLTEHIPENEVIVASSCSSNHFNELQAMFKNLHRTVFPKLNNFTMVLYDLGLTPQQRKVTEATCNCTVVTFPFKKFSAHVSDLGCYAWKPIVMRASIARARKLLVYQDSSIRWNTTFQRTWDRAMMYGQQAVLVHGVSFPGNTLKQMFDYMNEEVCPFRVFEELQGGIQMISNDSLVTQAVLHPWLKCALEKTCMCPDTQQQIAFCFSNNLHRCHRFDQSAFNLIMAKLYGVDRDKWVIPPDHHSVSISRKDRDAKYLYVLKYGEEGYKNLTIEHSGE
ncbi:hypothetical protein ElyMa_001140100 [Elysia marginata]|uniref:Uncharacterized protein n=1 Tax=Elysia marginata TaxID=1093978 RepID=A0AAV4HZL5_9GAST|nr:hypothetical protein ElyMa_001140100 [Elysia marginata]